MTEDEFHMKSNERRGFIIAHTITLERHLDEYIAEYFSDTKEQQIEMIEILVCKLNYSTKVNIFIEILNKITHPPLRPEYDKFRKKLLSVAKDRNRFAHDISFLDLSEADRKKYDIVLVNFSNIRERVNFTEKQLAEIGSKIQYCIDYIMTIRKLTQSGSPPA